eukprot:5008681-Alexandrium_andersonii.AAC.1
MVSRPSAASGHEGPELKVRRTMGAAPVEPMDTEEAASHFGLDPAQAALLRALGATVGARVDALAMQVAEIGARLASAEAKPTQEPKA